MQTSPSLNNPSAKLQNKPQGAATTLAAPAGPELLTPLEAAALLRISRTTIYRLVESRAIQFYRVAGALRFDRHDLLDYLARQRVPPIHSIA